MTLLGLLVVVVLVCLFVYLVQAWNPPQPIKNIIFAVVTLVILVCLLSAFGVLGPGFVLGGKTVR